MPLSWFRNKAKNYIVIRNTLDWEKAKIEDLKDEKIKFAARFWDQTFSISYTKCRHEIKNIATKCINNIYGGNIISYKNLELSKLNPDDLLVFCDDDDWYHPEIFNILKKDGAKNNDATIWHDSLYGYHISAKAISGKLLESCVENIRIRRIDDKDSFTPVKTNNYALSGRYFLYKNYDINKILEHMNAKKEIMDTEIRKVKI